MEFKPYSGNGKPFVYAMFAEEDREGAEAVLATLQGKGYEIWPSTRFDKKRIDKAALALFFLTPAAAANDAVNRAISYTAQSDHPLLAVHLAPTALTARATAAVKLAAGDSAARMRVRDGIL